jgi:hypothetical protein
VSKDEANEANGRSKEAEIPAANVAAALAANAAQSPPPLVRENLLGGPNTAARYCKTVPKFEHVTQLERVCVRGRVTVKRAAGPYG